MSKRKVSITIAMTEEDLNTVEKIAQENNVSIASVIRDLVHTALTAKETASKPHKTTMFREGQQN